MFFTAAEVETSSGPENIWASQSGTTSDIWGQSNSSQSNVPHEQPQMSEPQRTADSNEIPWDSPEHGSSSHDQPRSIAPLCRFFAAGRCSAGSACRFSHATSQDFMCGICSEGVATIGRKFGLLENCECVFCLDCLREWRNQKEKQDRINLRKCPLCRIDSFVVIPSGTFLVGEDKRREKEKYCQYLSSIPCKNFNAGQGKCQFGSSCLYRHEGATPVSEFVIIKGADGMRTKKSTQLSDYLRM